MELLHKYIINSFIEETGVQKGEGIVLAASGGPDSTALVRLLHELNTELGLRLYVAHFHHGLRGESADEDARFTRELARELGYPFFLERGDVREHRRKARLSVQEAARELRYEFLERTRRQTGSSAIALGHTRDDQVEEIIMRLIRGVGPEGLAGMPETRNATIIRPLLRIPKAELIGYLEKHGYGYREDPSNLEAKYLRNRARLKIIPQFRELNPRFDESVFRLSRLAREDNDYFEREIFKRWSELSVYEREDRVIFDRFGLAREHPALVSRLTRTAVAKMAGSVHALTMLHVEAVLDALYDTGRSAHFDLPHETRVEISHGEFVIHRADAARAWPEIAIVAPGVFPLEGFEGEIRLTLVDKPPKKLNVGPWGCFLDAKSLSWPMKLRSFRPGDRMEPLGLSGAKKLKNIFIDRKTPRWRRPLIPILESDGRIVWAGGVGPAEHARVKSFDRQALEVKCGGWFFDSYKN